MTSLSDRSQNFLCLSFTPYWRCECRSCEGMPVGEGCAGVLRKAMKRCFNLLLARKNSVSSWYHHHHVTSSTHKHRRCPWRSSGILALSILSFALESHGCELWILLRKSTLFNACLWTNPHNSPAKLHRARIVWYCVIHINWSISCC